MSTGLLTLASEGKTARSAATVSSASGEQRETGGLARVGAQNAQTAGVGEHRDPATAWQGLPVEQGGHVEQLLERVDPNDAGLVKQRIDGGLGAGECGGVRAGSPRAGGGPSGLHRDDRLRPRDAPRDARKLARVAEGLEVQQHDVGVRILFPVLEQVVRRDIRLVADGHEGREPEALFGCPLQQGEPECATLRREADLAGWKRTRTERGIESNVGHGDAETVRAEQPGSMRANQLEQQILARFTFGTDLGKACRDDAESSDACGERLFCRLEHRGAGQAHHCEIDGFSDLGDAPVSMNACNWLARPVDRIGDPPKLAAQHVAEELTADRTGA